MLLIDRTSELSLLNSQLHLTAQAGGRVVAITGPTAAGKTELVYAFGQDAVKAGATWLSATCSRTDRNLSLGVISQLFHSAALPIELASQAAELIESMTFDRACEEPPATDDRAWLHMTQRLWSAVLELSDGAPLLITVDDVEHADPPSWHLLLHFVQRLKSSNVFLVVTTTEDTQGMEPMVEVALTRHPHYQRVRVGMLPPDGVRRMWEQLAGGPAAHVLGPPSHAVTGGNPLLVKALIEDYVTAGQNAGELVVGYAFARSVRAVLHRGDPTVLQTARGLALLGEAAAHLLPELLGLSPVAVRQAMCALGGIGLLESGDFRHTAVRTAVLDGMSEEERTAMHAGAARLLHAEGAVPSAVARHLLESGWAGEPWALAELRVAADQALPGDQPEFAVRCLKLAIEVCADQDERTRLVAALARAEWRFNPAVVRQHLGPLAEAAREGRLSFDDTTTLLRYQLWHGALEAAGDTLRGLPEPDDDEAAQRLTATVDWLATTFPEVRAGFSRGAPGGVPGGPRVETRVETRAETRGESHAGPRTGRWSAAGGEGPSERPGERRGEGRSDGLLGGGGRHGARRPGSWGVWPAQGPSLLAAVLRDGPEEATLDGAVRTLQSVTLDDANLDTMETALSALIYSDQADRAEPWCDRLYEEAVHRRSPTWSTLLAAVRSAIAIRQGDLIAAEKYARASLAPLPPRGLGVFVGLSLAAQIRASTEMGRFDEAEQYLRRPLPEGLLQTRFGLHYLQARAHHYLATGQAQAALRDFTTCGTLMRSWGLDTPGLVPWRHGVATALLRLGQRGKARAVLGHSYALPGEESPRIRGMSRRVQAAAGDLPQRPALLREAVDLLQTGGDRLELTYALVDLTHALNELGESNKARLVGRQAGKIADEVQAEPLRKAVGPVEEPAGNGEEESMSLLSDAEQRVASLAALGYTNREISKKIYITVSTVEQHLTRIYRKLDVKGRRDLPDQFRRLQMR
ncbi:AAA family ATPase [Nonomuraea sp. NPDC048882]|uniref:helix-turn-helix transcriptional regulator n=1 Tax=Nonomuraea sp. NPDC048882 TaxID=3154347 RepID=UPI0033D55AD2